MRALAADQAFCAKYGVHIKDDEDIAVREYALRQQALHGDCGGGDDDDGGRRPPLLEFEARAKFDAWAELQGTPQWLAQHNYVTLLLAVFPVRNPEHLLRLLGAWRPQRPRRENSANQSAAIAPRRTKCVWAARNRKWRWWSWRLRGRCR